MKLGFPSGWGFGSTFVWAFTATLTFMLTSALYQHFLAPVVNGVLD